MPQKSKLLTLFKTVKNNFFLKISLIAFIVVAFTFNETGLMPAFAMIMTFAFLLKEPYRLFFKIKKYPIELKLLNCWVAWAYFTGVFTVKNINLFMNGFSSLILLVILINVIFLILVYDIRLIKHLIFAIFISGLLQILAIQFGFQTEEMINKEREYGLAGNPNSFGLKMVFASMSILIFMSFKKFKVNLTWIVAIALLIVFLDGVFDSGSRKSAMSFFVLIVGFIGIYKANQKYKLSISKIFIPLLIIGLITYALIPIIMEGTVLEERFEMGEERGGVEGDIRYKMFTFGLQLFADNPIFGVGLNNYRVYFFSGQYSHSDYVESLTSTGLFGFIIYQFVYIMAIIKSYKLSKIIMDKQVRFNLLFCTLIVITTKIIGLGIILYNSPSAMIIMVGVIGYVYHVEQRINNKSLSTF
ncbi:O-antigen ligase family protein [Brumimicrobium oceani]|uniref:O-antigen ligase-related domain-containing protein n=1 Tax=Brumimicrobium oceani TaxID=2100725 RepID=A0A2U2XF45_9FLAO|nr:O-antigen ligase family protein [Brumimicrobium oceani]PWH86414.1 hypothetical protein DIT68_04020 [Brumimicrobium oceani]